MCSCQNEFIVVSNSNKSTVGNCKIYVSFSRHNFMFSMSTKHQMYVITFYSHFSREIINWSDSFAESNDFTGRPKLSRERKKLNRQQFIPFDILYDFIVVFGIIFASTRTVRGGPFVKWETFQINLLKLFHIFFASLQYQQQHWISLGERKKSHRKMKHFNGFNDFPRKKSDWTKFTHFICLLRKLTKAV